MAKNDFPDPKLYSAVACLMDHNCSDVKHTKLGTAHYLLGVWGWKYSILGNNFFVKVSIWGNNFFSKHIYGARTFLTETESCSGGS